MADKPKLFRFVRITFNLNPQIHTVSQNDAGLRLVASATDPNQEPVLFLASSEEELVVKVIHFLKGKIWGRDRITPYDFSVRMAYTEESKIDSAYGVFMESSRYAYNLANYQPKEE